MSKKITREDRLSYAFLVFGSQYYSLARYTAQNYFLPITATLFHHSIEFLLKGCLCQSRTPNELKQIGHNIVTLWNLFLTAENKEELSRFNTSISHLNKVEFLRYPDSFIEHGYALNVRIAPPGIRMHVPGEDKLPSYHVDVLDLDSIVLEIFDACGVSPIPYFKNIPEQLKDTLPSEFLDTHDS